MAISTEELEIYIMLSKLNFVSGSRFNIASLTNVNARSVPTYSLIFSGRSFINLSNYYTTAYLTNYW